MKDISNSCDPEKSFLLANDILCLDDLKIFWNRLRLLFSECLCPNGLSASVAACDNILRGAPQVFSPRITRN